MQFWTDVRREVLTGKLSKRAACRKYQISWHTLKKILAHEQPPGYRLKKPRTKRKIEPFLGVIRQILKDDQEAPAKQRHTVKRIFQRLQKEHQYDGSYTTVKVAVRELRVKRREVFLPLKHPPGEAQVDFGEATVILNGESTKVAYFVMTLPYSGAMFVQTFRRECTETFLESHRLAFDYFGGVPNRISYDNSAIAVIKVLKGRDRVLTKEFLRLQSCYLFKEHFCMVRRANEKGHVERLLGIARKQFLVPVPRVSSLKTLNQTLIDDCKSDLKNQTRGKPAPKECLLKEDQAHFLPLPKQPFEARRLACAHADSQSLVRFDTNSYSVPSKFAHRKITVVATVDHVRLIFDDKLIACFERCWEKEKYFFNPLHYLAVLEKKPGGFDHAVCFENWPKAKCFSLLRRRLVAKHGGTGNKYFAQVLRLAENIELGQLTDAVEDALSIGAIDPDSIQLIAEYKNQPATELFSLAGRPHLALVNVEKTDLASYQSLLKEGQ